MKPFTSLLTAALLSAASLSACGGSENRMSIQEQTEKRFQLNPHPTKAYRIKIKINDAPGPLKPVGKMSVGYIAENCSYTIAKFAGAKAKPEKDVYTEVKQIGADEYESTIYLDAMRDEDYFGQGVCHWQAYSFAVGFKATGKPNETNFGIGEILEEILSKKTRTIYFWKRGYPYYRNDDGSVYNKDDMYDSGYDSLNDYIAQRRNELFTMTVQIEEIE
ncbi:MAG: hypothetical protein Q4A84_00500 [Neisseria sp.]|uniref:hypothetical protein n=1 Tax=Neisseria sp. TaxID=192066 RepID=UPI0026DC0E92|nr:hypothetical protein [Neisseria sp.]MDO4640175.1 hypothetical protein [Neisseria sp.]